jgi:signal transduction histidine kinase
MNQRTRTARRSGTPRRRLVAVGVGGLLGGPGAVALAATGDSSRPPEFFVLVLAIAWGFIGTGLYARWRRPASRAGVLMAAVGFAWLLPALTARNEPALFTAGLVVDAVWVGLLFHLVLAFPSGRLQRRLDRSLVAGGYVLVTVLEIPPLLFGPGCDGCPDQLLLVDEDRSVATALVAFQLLLGLCVLLLAGGSLLRRWRRASPVERRPLEPVLWMGTITLVAVLVTEAAVATAVPWLARIGDWLVVAAFVLVPFAFLAGLLRSRLYRGTAVTGLVGSLRSLPDPGSLRRVVAEALCDPTVEVVYWARDVGTYVDSAGEPVTLPAAGGSREATVVVGQTDPIAAILHDAALRDEPQLVQAVGSAASLWLENERLHAELRGRLAELRASRARVVGAADAERRRIERDLHDGAQQRLVSLLLQIRLARRAGTPAESLLSAAENGLDEAVAELRALAAGILPPVLADRGLGPALLEMVGGHPLAIDVREVPADRLPGVVETTAYFVVAEALANAVKHARARGVTLSVVRRNGSLLIDVRDDGVGGADPVAGSGLRGLADRVGALDGRLVCESPPGRGTTLSAEIPCAS